MKYLPHIIAAAAVLAFILAPCGTFIEGFGTGQCPNPQQVLIPQKDCPPPNILVDDRCCPDADDNGVCDEVDVVNMPKANVVTLVESTTTTTYETTTTTTTTSTTSTTTSTTTTTLKKPVERRGCMDSDEGESYGTPGYTEGYRKMPPYDRVNMSDVCVNNRTVREYRCEEGEVYSRDHLCDSWQICLNGECCLADDSDCKTSADCCSGRCMKKAYTSRCY